MSIRIKDATLRTKNLDPFSRAIGEFVSYGHYSHRLPPVEPPFEWSFSSYDRIYILYADDNDPVGYVTNFDIREYPPKVIAARVEAAIQCYKNRTPPRHPWITAS